MDYESERLSCTMARGSSNGESVLHFASVHIRKACGIAETVICMKQLTVCHALQLADDLMLRNNKAGGMMPLPDVRCLFNRAWSRARTIKTTCSRQPDCFQQLIITWC